jgi:nucleoside-diphosphate-sugar epimerase
VEPELKQFFGGRAVLVTGGAGFIGSNLVHRLVELGARVTVVDALVPDHGGNLFNLDGVRDRISLSVIDLHDADALGPLVRNQSIIFNLAGQVSHEDSMRDPASDLAANCSSHVRLLEVCRRRNPDVRVVFTSTRQVYGRSRYLPVDEDHPLQPIDPNGVNKLAAERYHLLYHELFGIWASVLRLTNTYGPRQLIRHARQGFIAWFVRKRFRVARSRSMAPASSSVT